MRFGLDRMHKLMTVLGMPQRRFASIHVVGSNGKSSTTRMIAAILERHGLRTGTYTSPHLRSFAERIEVRERPLDGPSFAAAVERAAHAAEGPRRAPGAFQRRNFAVARTAAEAFLGELDSDAVRRAADEVVVPGRMQVVGDDPLVVYDGAHNPSGAAALDESLPEVVGERRPVVGVVAVLDDKDAAGMLQALAPRFDHIVFTRSAHPRS